MSGNTVWALALGFLAGVFARSLLAVSWPWALLPLLLALCFVIYRLTDIRRRSTQSAWAVVPATVFCIACGVGIMRMEHAALAGDPVLAGRIGESVTIIGTVAREPDVREKSVRLHVRVRDVVDKTNATTSVSADVLVIAPAHTEAAYGDTIRAEGRLSLPEAFDTAAGRTFDYPMYLAKDGILYTLSFAQVKRTGETHTNSIVALALSIKHAYLSGLGRVLPEPHGSLAAGITVGDKRSIGQELSDTFLAVSLVHILVLSGYNMTVVINAAAHVLAFLPRTGRFLASAGIVLLFVLMTGGAASATRAGAMALLAVFARLTGRTFLALRVLAVVAAGMVAWNPYLLAFDPGFQLSVLATLGLVILTPPVSKRLAFLTEHFGIREIVASSIATHIMVLPLLLWQSGNLSLVALPANLLALVAVPWAMFASFLAAIAGVVLGGWGVPLALPAIILLAYLVEVARFFASFPFASVTVPEFGAWVLCAVYAAMLAGYMVYQKKNARDRVPGAAPQGAEKVLDRTPAR